MNRDVKPLHAVLISCFFIILVLCYIWADGEALKIDGAFVLYENQDNHIYMQVGNRLLQFDGDGLIVDDISLKDIGVEDSIGGMLFLNNSDVIIRVGKDTRTFTENVRAFLRLTNTDTTQFRNVDSGLSRCDLQHRTCNRFARNNVDYNSVFHLQRDDYDGGVFLSDPNRHSVVKFDALGNQLFIFDEGLKFPNRMKFIDNRLYIANTNAKKVKLLNVKNDGLELIRDIDVIPDIAIFERETFPVEITSVGEHWWVILMNGSMSDGGVYRFDNNWKFINRLDLPENADPINLLSLNNGEVIISDPGNFNLYRFDSSGKRLQDYVSEILDDIIEERKAKHDYYVNLSYVPVSIFIVALVAGFIVAISAEMKDKALMKAAPSKCYIKPDKDAELIWLSVNTTLLRNLNYMMVAVYVLLIIISLFLYTIYESIDESADLISSFSTIYLFFILFPIILIIYFKHVIKARIGIQGDYIHLVDHRGKATKGHISEVYYDHRAIVLNDVAVLTGNKMKPFYQKDEVVKYLYPLLVKANMVNAIQMSLMLYKVRHPSTYLEASIIIFCLISLYIYW